MTITVNTKAYSEDAQINQNAVRYAGPNQTFAVTDRIDLKRTPPKVTSQSQGVAKSSLKTSRSFLVGTEYKTVIIESNVSIPVGVAAADAQAVLDDHEALIGGAVGTAVAINHDLKH